MSHDLAPEEFERWKRSECIVCGSPYVPASYEHLFCGSACRQRKYRERFRAHAGRWDQKRSPRNAKCADCGVQFAAGARGMVPTRCLDCKKAARRVS